MASVATGTGFRGVSEKQVPWIERYFLGTAGRLTHRAVANPPVGRTRVSGDFSQQGLAVASYPPVRSKAPKGAWNRAYAEIGQLALSLNHPRAHGAGVKGESSSGKSFKQYTGARNRGEVELVILENHLLARRTGNTRRTKRMQCMPNFKWARGTGPRVSTTTSRGGKPPTGA